MDADVFGLEHWTGNARVDALARQMARRVKYTGAERDGGGSQAPGTTPEQGAIEQAAMAMAWSIGQWPAVGPRTGRKPRRKNTALDAGPHSLVPRASGGRECVRCKLFTRTDLSLKALRSTPCLGTIASQCHSTHLLRWQRGVLWCTRCARYTVRIPRTLRLPCPGRPGTEAARNVWRRLHEGLHPTTARYLIDEERGPADYDGRSCRIDGAATGPSVPAGEEQTDDGSAETSHLAPVARGAIP